MAAAAEPEEVMYSERRDCTEEIGDTEDRRREEGRCAPHWDDMTQADRDALVDRCRKGMEIVRWSDGFLTTDDSLWTEEMWKAYWAREKMLPMLQGMLMALPVPVLTAIGAETFWNRTD